MTRDELGLLRSEAKRFLEFVQQVRGFGARRASLPEVPEAVAALPFWSVRRLARSDDSGKVVWRQWHSSDQPSDRESILRLQALQGLGYPVRVNFDDGTMGWRLPEYVRVTEDPAREEIERYREAIEHFAERMLLDAQWAASALHDALREGLPIRLPPAPSEGFVKLPLEAPLVLDPREPRPRDELRRLGEFLLAVGGETNAPDLPGGRAAIWDGAVEAIAQELEGGPLSNTQRSNRLRGRRFLNGAVNGELDLEEPGDWAFDRAVGETGTGRRDT